MNRLPTDASVITHLIFFQNYANMPDISNIKSISLTNRDSLSLP